MAEQWLMAHGEATQYIVFFVLLMLLGLAEIRFPRHLEPARRGRRWAANFGLTALNVVVLGMLPMGFIGAAAYAHAAGLGLLNAAHASAPVAVGVTLAARSFLSFAIHRLMHGLPWLWRIHRVHHFDTRLDISTTVRFHPAEFVVQMVLGLPVVLLLGLSPATLMAYEITDAAVNLWSHSNVRLPAALNRALRLLIVTPDLHRVHHSTQRHETDSNFGAVLPVWDLLFGSFRTTTSQPLATMPVGLHEVRDERVESVAWLLRSPWLDLASGAAQPPRAGDLPRHQPGPSICVRGRNASGARPEVDFQPTTERGSR